MQLELERYLKSYLLERNNVMNIQLFLMVDWLELVHILIQKVLQQVVQKKQLNIEQVVLLNGLIVENRKEIF